MIKRLVKVHMFFNKKKGNVIETKAEGQMLFGKGDTKDSDFQFTLMLIMKILINSYI